MAYANRGRALATRGRHEEADADFTRALEIYAADRTITQRSIAEPLHGLGEVRLARGQVRVAVSYLDESSWNQGGTRS